MAPRANWKGTLKLAELLCPVALYTAASTSDRIAFHTINRATGNRVRRDYVDSETGDVVAKEEQVKGYETAAGEHVVLDPDEIAAAVPDSDKVLAIDAFIPCDEVDEVHFDKPYYLAPVDRPGSETYALLREGLAKRQVVAIARTVLFRKVRSLLIRPQGPGMIATTLNFSYEVRPAGDAFADIPEVRIEPEMLDLARHIIDTKKGSFDITAFDDRYEAALADLVRAKAEGRSIAPPAKRDTARVVDLMTALRESAGAGARKPARRRKGAPAAPPRRKSG